MSYNRGGFTLIELMAAIAIIGILATMAVTLNFDSISDREKRDRLVNAVVSTIRSEDTRRITGKWIGSPIDHPSTTQIILSGSGMTVQYLSGTTIIGTGAILSAPFYGESQYKVGLPVLFDGSGVQKSVLSIGELLYINLGSNGETSISTSNTSTGITVEIPVWYGSGAMSSSIVRFDSRGNTVTVRNP